jgi:hypothetical protein
MAEQLPDTYYRTPFKFNGKELDEGSGFFFGVLLRIILYRIKTTD